MRVAVAASVVAWFFAAAASAQAVAVRSGEHDGFTRLVLRLPDPGAAWRIERGVKSARLTLPGQAVAFDTGAVFGRIPRTRLVRLAQDGPGAPLVMDLACDCPVRGFVEPGGFLVIDIRDPVAPEWTGPMRWAAPANQRPYRLPGRDAVAPSDRAGAVAALPVTREGDRTGAALHEPPVPAGSVPLRGAVNASEQRLRQQIDRAFRQGLIEPAGSAPDPAPLPTRDVAATREGGAGADPGPEPWRPPARDSESALNATTVFDRDLAAIARSQDRAEKSPACLPSGLVAVADWGGGGFPETIGALRASLYGEFDRPRPDVALDLARAYLHFGFGAEARLVLDTAGLNGPEAEVARALARVLDERPLASGHPLEGQHACKGDAALWSVLAADGLPDGTHRDAVHRAFARLPLHLRIALGPRISRRFAEAGDTRMAETLLRIATRTGASHAPGLQLARAATARGRGDRKSEIEALAEPALSGSRDAAEALADLVFAKYAARGSVAPETVELIAAHAQERRSTALGPRLRQAHAVALALSGRVQAAFDAIDGDMAEDEADGVLTPLFILLAERGDDVTFLRLALGRDRPDVTHVSEEAVAKIAGRLVELGFPDAAAGWLDIVAAPEDVNRHRLLRARVALAQGLPYRALVELLPLDSAEAVELRAEALVLNGDHETAGRMLAAAGKAEDATRDLWLAGSWDAAAALAEDRDTRFAAIARDTLRLRPEPATAAPGAAAAGPARQGSGAGTAANEAAPDPAAAASLSGARELLEHSARARDDIRALLAHFRSDADGGAAGPGAAAAKDAGS